MKDLSVVKFYKDILGLLDLEVKDNGQLFTLVNNKETLLMIGGLPAFLPTDENIKTMYNINNGTCEKIKELFNPLNENVSSATNPTFMKFRNILEYKLSNIFFYIGETLLLITMSKEEIDDLNIVKFTSLLSRYKGGASKLIDNKTLELWSKVYENIINKHNNKKYINTLVRKGGLIDNIRYNRVGVITFPLGEDIVKLNNKERILLDVNLRNKDVEVFKTIYEYLIGEENIISEGFMLGSLNKNSPSIHTLLLMYDKLYNKINPIIQSILNIGVDEDMAKMLSFPKLPYDVANLSDIIDSYETDIIKIPNDLSKPVVNEQVVTPNLNNGFNTNSGNSTIVNEEPSISNNFNIGKQQTFNTVSSPFGDVVINKPNNNFINDNNGFNMSNNNNMYNQQFTNSNQQFNNNNNQPYYIVNNKQHTQNTQVQSNQPVVVNRYTPNNAVKKSRYS